MPSTMSGVDLRLSLIPVRKVHAVARPLRFLSLILVSGLKRRPVLSP